MDRIGQFYHKTDGRDTNQGLMLGIVTNVNDPQQLGRVQVSIPSFGEDDTNAKLDHLPWASRVSPIGGVDDSRSRGIALKGQDRDSPYGSKSSGSIAYGFWSIPTVGTTVVLFCIDNDPNQLYYIGTITPNSTYHTLPHGRYITDVPGGDKGPEGPLSSTEAPIEPLYSKSMLAFGGHTNFEWRSRGADYGSAAISPNRMNLIDNDNNDEHTGVVSKKIDDRETSIVEEDGHILGNDLLHRQGYAMSRTDPKKKTDDQHHKDRNKDVEKNLESSVHSWTTPGFHAIAMDDRPENCRVRFRTTTGHQIIMDDTNERIYISTCEGRNWFEMDADGHIYAYSEESISFCASGDINFTAKKTIRMKAEEGIHLHTPKDFRLHALEDIHIIGERDMFTTITRDKHTHIKQNSFTTIDGTSDVHIVGATKFTLDSTFDFDINGVSKFTCAADINIHTNAILHIKSNGNTLIESSSFGVKSGNFSVDTSGNVQHSASLKTGADIVSGGNVKASNGQDLAGLMNHTHMYNPGPLPPASTIGFQSTGGSASSSPSGWGGSDAATAVDSEDAEKAYWTNIVPAHEPWGRVYMKNYIENIEHIPEFEYDDPSIARSMKRSGIEDDRERNPLWHR